MSLHAGAPNKNIGDAFLLVWKFPKTFSFRDVLPHLKEEEKNANIFRQPSALNLAKPQTIVAPGQELDSVLMLQTVTTCATDPPSHFDRLFGLRLTVSGPAATHTCACLEGESAAQLLADTI